MLNAFLVLCILPTLVRSQYLPTPIRPQCLPTPVKPQCTPLVIEWETYNATYVATYDKSTQICKYPNVRFAGPPTGTFRFQAAPTPHSTDPPAPTSITCISVNASEPCAPNGADLVLGKSCKPPLETTFSEDCLFLDIYVPLAALSAAPNSVPVVVWFYGGAFVYGSKSEFDITTFPLYSGDGPLGAAKEPLIFVAGNYRLGAFGWLAGATMEQVGLTNAGLHDQRRVLEFVQDNIHLVKGNSSAVSAWGESAGAASILHHLVAQDGQDGQQDPLFSKAVLQSPAYQWQWDNSTNGTLDKAYQRFASLSECPDYSIECLQNASIDTLSAANQELFRNETLCNGIFLVGPSVDKDLITTLPAVAFSEGKFWNKLDSLIVSHVNNEVSNTSDFIPYPIKQNVTGAFDQFLLDFMPQYSLNATRHEIATRYACANYSGDQIKRAAAMIQDSSFVCNTRQLYDAYSPKTPVYMMNYHFLADYKQGYAVHGSDLIPTFYSATMDLQALLCKLPTLFVDFLRLYIQRYARSYQSYLTSHALYGNPNQGARHGAAKVKWAPAGTSADGNFVQNVMEPYLPSKTDIALRKPFFRIAARDVLNTDDVCSFWSGVASQVMLAQNASGPEGLLTVQTSGSAWEL